MNSGSQLELSLLLLALLFPWNARFANTLQADQFHAATANVYILHHFAAGGEVGDVLAMTAGKRVGFNLTKNVIKQSVDPARFDHQLRQLTAR